jgi:hypothetical protein
LLSDWSKPNKESGHIFEENHGGLHVIDDSENCWPEISIVSVSELLSGDGVGLAGRAGVEDIHKSTEASAVECSNVIPDRRWSQRSVFHLRCQKRSGWTFPLHVTDIAESRHCDFECAAKSADPGK